MKVVFSLPTQPLFKRLFKFSNSKIMQNNKHQKIHIHAVKTFPLLAIQTHLFTRNVKPSIIRLANLQITQHYPSHSADRRLIVLSVRLCSEKCTLETRRLINFAYTKTIVENSLVELYSTHYQTKSYNNLIDYVCERMRKCDRIVLPSHYQLVGG